MFAASEIMLWLRVAWSSPGSLGWLASQSALRICLSPPSLCWDYTRVTLCLVLYMDCVHLSFYWVTNTLSNWAISPHLESETLPQRFMCKVAWSTGSDRNQEMWLSRLFESWWAWPKRRQWDPGIFPLCSLHTDSMVISFVLQYATFHNAGLHSRPQCVNWNQRVSQDKSSLFISWISQVFCYSNENLINTAFNQLLPSHLYRFIFLVVLLPPASLFTHC